MSSARLEASIARLRRDFDDGFARKHVDATSNLIDLLEISVAGRRYAVRLQQIEAVLADRKLVRAPSPRPDLLGLANLGGTIAPIYDLAQLLGHAPRPEARWLALLRSAAPFSVAFDRFERHLRVRPEAITSASAGDEAHASSSASVQTDSGPIPLIDLLVLQQTVTSGAGDKPPPEPRGTP